jgi:hypothetical protein
VEKSENNCSFISLALPARQSAAGVKVARHVGVSVYQQENAAKRYECACNEFPMLLLSAND